MFSRNQVRAVNDFYEPFVTVPETRFLRALNRHHRQQKKKRANTERNGSTHQKNTKSTPSCCWNPTGGKMTNRKKNRHSSHVFTSRRPGRHWACSGSEAGYEGGSRSLLIGCAVCHVTGSTPPPPLSVIFHLVFPIFSAGHDF